MALAAPGSEVEEKGREVVQPYEFEEPREGGDRYSAEQAQNRRLIVVPIEYVPVIRTQRGDEVDGIRINVVDLDADGQPAEYFGALWFGGNLIKALKTKIGKMFLGYVNKELTSGGFKSWQFHSLTQDEQTVAMAQAFLAAHPEFLETCQGDVRYAETNAAQARAPERTQQGPAQFNFNPSQGQWQEARVPQQPVTPPIFSPSQPPAPMVPAPPAAPATTTPPPAPGQQSVMERLKAQREAEQTNTGAGNGFENGPAPF